MNVDTTPTKSTCNQEHTSPVFNHIKTKRKSSDLSYIATKKKKIIDHDATSSFPNIFEVNNKDCYKTDFLNADNISDKKKCIQKPNILYGTSFKKSFAKTKSDVKNILFHAKNLEYVNATDKKIRNKTIFQHESQGFQSFSNIKNAAQNNSRIEFALENFLTNSELITTNDLLQDFATKVIDFSQWTGNTEMIIKSTNSIISETNKNNQIINKDTVLINDKIIRNLDEDADIKEFHGFISENKKNLVGKKDFLSLLKRRRTSNSEFIKNSVMENTEIKNGNFNNSIESSQNISMVGKSNLGNSVTSKNNFYSDIARCNLSSGFARCNAGNKINNTANVVNSNFNKTSITHSNEIKILNENNYSELTTSSKKITTTKDFKQEFKKTFEKNDSSSKENIISSDFIGFQTASGKKTLISADALKKATNIFQDETNLARQQIHDFTENNNFRIPDSMHFKGSIPEYGTSFALNDFLSKQNKLHEEKFVDNISAGFQTASGHNISISRNSLQKAENILKEEGNSYEEFANHKYSNVQTFYSAFGLNNESTFKSNQKSTFHNELSKQVQINSEKSANDGKFQDFETENDKNTFISKVVPHQEHIKDESIAKKIKVFDKNLELFENTQKSSTAQFENISEKLNLNIFSGFPGFQLASGKMTSVSNKSLQKARKLFEDKDMLIEENDNVQNLPAETILIIKNTGADVDYDEFSNQQILKSSKDISINNNTAFLLASGKNILVSNDVLHNVKNPFEKRDFAEVSLTSNENCTKILDASSDMDVSNTINTLIRKDEFRKAEKIIDKTGFSKTQLLLEKSFDENMFLNRQIKNADERTCIDTNSGFTGFQSASGKKISVSNDLLQKANKLFVDNDSFPFLTFTEISERDKNSSKSKEALQVDENLHNNENILMLGNFVNEQFYNEKTADVKSVFTGFQSARGKKTSISYDSLQKAKKLFDEQDYFAEALISSQCLNKSVSDLPIKSKNTSIYKDLMEKKENVLDDDTFSNKQISTEKMFKDDLISSKQFENKSIDADIDNSSGITGFQMTSGKKALIYNDSLQKEKKLFANKKSLLEESIKFKEKNALNDNDRYLPTASCKNILISKNNLATNTLQETANLIMEEYKTSPKLFEKRSDKITVNNNVGFTGFQLASGKTSSISNNSLQKAKKLFEDVDSFSEETIISSQNFPINHQNISYLSTSKTGKKIPKCKDTFSNIFKDLQNNFKENDKSNSILENMSDTSQNDSFGCSKAKVVWKLNKGEFSKTSTVNDNSEMEKDIYAKMPSSPILMRNPVLIKNNSRTLIQSANEMKERLNKAYQEFSKNSLNYDNLSQEIKDITSAFIADEMSINDNSIFEGSMVTSPSGFLNDVPHQIKPIVTSDDLIENEVTQEHFTVNKSTGSNDMFTMERDTVIKNNLNSNILNKNSNLKNNSIEEELMVINDTQIISKIDGREVTEEVCSMRSLEYEKQKLKIKYIKKRKIDCKVLKGSCVTNKISSSNRISWTNYTKGVMPQKFDNNTLLYKYHLKKNVIDVTIKNVYEFAFSAWDFYSTDTCKTNISGIICGDGAVLILNENNKIPLERIVTGFQTSPGVDINIVSEIWIRNHFKWIILKLASMERSFPTLFANKACTPHNLMLQLKYRYDREIDKVEQSCLKKILQADDTPSKPMILYCADIYEQQENVNFSNRQILYELELSDGWYSVRTKIDHLLSKAISNGKFKVGDKIYAVGSTLLNCIQGCDPLDVPKHVRLQIFSNSCTRARWDARLGFTGSKPMLPCLGTVHYLGGVIHSTEFVIVRRYPMVYLVKHKGKTTMHSEKLELKLCQEYEQKRNDEIEKIYSQVRKYYDEESTEHVQKICVMNEKDVTKTRCPEELYDLMRTSHDPSAFQNLLTYSQKTLMLEHCDKKRNAITNEIYNRVQTIISSNEELSKRQSSQLLKIRVIPLCRDSKPDHKRSVIVSIWRPNSITSDLLAEKKIIRANNCTAESIRNGDLQLSAGRQASFKEISNKKKIGVATYPYRTFTSITQMYNINFEPDFNEVDTIGVIFYISSYRNSNSFQSVYIADLNKKIIEISFWGGIQHHGYEKLIKMKSIVACSNLQWRTKNIERHIPYMYVTDMTTFSINPQQIHFKEVFNNFNKKLENNIDQFVRECKESLYKIRASSSTIKNGTPQRKYSPSIYAKVVNKNTPPSVQRKLEILSAIPEPPILSPVAFKTPTKKNSKPFKPPLLVLTKINNDTIEGSIESPPLSLE